MLEVKKLVMMTIQRLSAASFEIFQLFFFNFLRFYTVTQCMREVLASPYTDTLYFFK
jgi:hypothetical protein